MATATMKMKKILILIALITAISGCSHKRTLYKFDLIKSEGVSACFEELIGHFPANKAHWGIIVQNEAGKELVSYNSEKLFVPASTLKLITAATVWNTLGPEYRIPTFISYNGFTNNNILFGDLVITGTGDPTFDKRHWRDPVEIFQIWADSLRAHGISEIRGDIIGDDDLFEDLHLGAGWAWDDLSFPFSAEFGALMANNTTAEVSIIPPDDSIDEITFIDNLPFSYLDYENSITISDTLRSRVHARRLPGKNTIRLFGNFTPDSEIANKSVTAANPTLFYTELLKSVLIDNGITISGNAKDIDDLPQKPQNLTPVFNWYSVKMKYIINQFLHDSNNQAGETLLRHTAWHETGFGSFKNGKMIVEVFMENINVTPLDYKYKDSCGLSRYNLLSPVALNKVLIKMHNNPEWQSCLSQPGFPGTLKKRLTILPDPLYAKTGSMSGISALAGYLYKNDKKLIFTIMVNNYNNSQKSQDIIDHIIYMLNN